MVEADSDSRMSTNGVRTERASTSDGSCDMQSASNSADGRISRTELTPLERTRISFAGSVLKRIQESGLSVRAIALRVGAQNSKVRRWTTGENNFPVSLITCPEFPVTAAIGIALDAISERAAIDVTLFASVPTNQLLALQMSINAALAKRLGGT